MTNSAGKSFTLSAGRSRWSKVLNSNAPLATVNRASMTTLRGVTLLVTIFRLGYPIELVLKIIDDARLHALQAVAHEILRFDVHEPGIGIDDRLHWIDRAAERLRDGALMSANMNFGVDAEFEKPRDVRMLARSKHLSDDCIGIAVNVAANAATKRARRADRSRACYQALERADQVNDLTVEPFVKLVRPFIELGGNLTIAADDDVEIHVR